VEIDAEDTIGALKARNCASGLSNSHYSPFPEAKLTPLTGAAVGVQKLIFKGKTAKDEVTISALGIKDGGKLMLMAATGEAAPTGNNPPNSPKRTLHPAIPRRAARGCRAREQSPSGGPSSSPALIPLPNGIAILPSGWTCSAVEGHPADPLVSSPLTVLTPTVSAICEWGSGRG
jgi:hypothetical protein